MRARDPEARQPPIREYAVIGDCRTAALVSSGGSIDWLCVPRFEGASVFGAILDAHRGGRFRIAPAGGARGERRYVPGTNVLVTTFRAAGGVIEVTDLFAVGDEADRFTALTPDHEILRRVRCLEGSVDVEVLYDPRPAYGTSIPELRRYGALGWFLSDRADALALRSEIELRPRSGSPGLGGQARLHAGETRWLSLATERGLPAVLEPLGAAAEERLRQTVAWWTGWSGACSYDGEHRELVLRSALTLKLLAFPPSGSIVAAPTTSLPEGLGSGRTWDYRYCWLRDAAMTLRVLLDIGFAHEAEAFLGWLLHATRQTRRNLKVLYDVHGRPGQRERELSHLSGYRGSGPVRVGNGAHDQFQLDIYGELIGASYEFCRRGGELDSAEGGLISDMAEVVCRRWRDPDRGIWELRNGPRQITHSKAMCWVALDRAGRLADEGRIELDIPRPEVEREKEAIRRFIEEEGVDAATGAYVAFCDGGEETDAALLLLGIEGYEDAGSGRMRRTLERVREGLGENGLLYRYRYDDGLREPEPGAFGICTFWEAELLARMGEIEEARRVFERAAREANDVGLFSEEIDPDGGGFLGNFPQAFTHVGLISAANAIARAEGHGPEEEAAMPETTEARSGVEGHEGGWSAEPSSGGRR